MNKAFQEYLGLVIRGTLGGVLMGLANLVPGISGGTMLLATGIYPAFIAAIADISTLRLRLPPLVLLGTVAVAAGLAILLFAGVFKNLVIDHRWLMYSIFIGLTLGGVPLVWRLAQPVTPAVLVGALAGFAVMLLLSLGAQTGNPTDGGNYLLLAIAGLAGASAMILPGVSGGYLLLLLGQYEIILDAIDHLKLGLIGNPATGAPADLALAMEALHVVIPVGIGVLVGIVGVSNLIKWLLNRYSKPTLGVLLGLLFGAVVGLWPFQQTIAPNPGDILNGQTLTAETIAELDVKHWPISFFEPTAVQILTALGLIVLGFVATQLIGRIGHKPAE